MISGGFYQENADPQGQQYQQVPPPQSGNPYMSPDVFKYAQLLANGLPIPAELQNISAQKISQSFKQGQSLIPPYLAVTRNSFLHRIKNLACPFIVKQWSRSVQEGQTCNPIENPNAPELYTPLVFTFIYMLITSLIEGTQQIFSMQRLYINIIKLVSILLIEVFLTRFLFQQLGVQGTYPVLSLLADFSCVSFYITIVSLVSWSKLLYWITYIYCSAAVLLWTLRTLNSENCMAQRQIQSTQAVTYLLLVLAIVQIIILFLLSPRIY